MNVMVCKSPRMHAANIIYTNKKIWPRSEYTASKLKKKVSELLLVE